MASSTVEDYLKLVFLEGQESGGRVSMGTIATALRVAPGTVTAMMKTLSSSGLVEYEPYAGVRLTPSGRQLALHVLRRHRLIELFLVQILGMDWSEVHEEADLLEHAASDRLVEHIDEILGYPKVDPHGDPIPDSRGEVDEADNEALLRCTPGSHYVVARVGSQEADFLRLVDRSGLRPGRPLRFVKHDPVAETVELETADGQSVSLGSRAAAKIRVTPVVD
jgi:DtxR family Mn-dependent transcriptional regulator